MSKKHEKTIVILFFFNHMVVLKRTDLFKRREGRRR